MLEHVTIPLFSPLWWLGFWIMAIIVTAIVVYATSLSAPAEGKFRRVLAYIFLGREILHQCYMYATDTWVVEASLPLHLCGISSIVSIILLFSPKQKLFEFLALLGLAGAIHSFLTPELTHGSSLYHYVDYYLSHGGIIMTAFYMRFVIGMKPELNSWWNVFLWGNGVLIIVGTINYLIAANYIYLCTPPIASNPLILGPWPYYLIGFEVAGIIHIYLLYKVFRKSYSGFQLIRSNAGDVN